MRIRKFIRANSRTLLMIFMALLLVAFLIPNTITQLGGPERRLNRKWGTAFGRKITDRDLERVHADLAVLARAGLAPRATEEAVLDYYLLMEEARRLGVRVGREEVKTGLLQLGLTDEHLQNIQRAVHRSYNDIYDVIGRWLAVQRLIALQTSALVNSLPREQLAYRDRTEDVVAQLSIIDDRAFLHLVEEPSEEQLQAFFEECKGRAPAHTEQELRYGYLLPDRVDLEYLTVDPQKVQNEITIQAVQARRFFEENAHRYTKPDPQATQPVGGQVPQVPMTFEEAQDRVREDFRQVRAIEVAQGLVNDMYLEAHQPWAAMPREASGFAATPSGQMVSFEELKTRFSAAHPVEYHRTGLRSAEELAALPGIGQAGFRMGQQTIGVAELAMRVKGLLEKDPGDGKPVLNLMEPAPVVLTTKRDPRTGSNIPYQAYLFRVVAVAPSAPPESLDALRNRVVEDWKLTRAHELAGQYAQALADRARAVGLPAAVAEAEELKQILAAAEQAASQPADAASPPLRPQYVQNLEPFTPASKITRKTPFLQKVGRVAELPQKLFELTQAPVSEAEPFRAAALPLASQHRWIVAEVITVNPLYEGSFEAQLDQSLHSSDWELLRRFRSEWTAAENLRLRTGFVMDPGFQPMAR